MPKDAPEPTVETIAETENYLAWKAAEPDNETTYHIEMGNITLNFFQEEWEEFLDYAGASENFKPDEDGLFVVEFYNVGVWLDDEDWKEFKSLLSLIKKK